MCFEDDSPGPLFSLQPIYPHMSHSSELMDSFISCFYNSKLSVNCNCNWFRFEVNNSWVKFTEKNTEIDIKCKFLTCKDKAILYFI